MALRTALTVLKRRFQSMSFGCNIQEGIFNTLLHDRPMFGRIRVSVTFRDIWLFSLLWLRQMDREADGHEYWKEYCRDHSRSKMSSWTQQTLIFFLSRTVTVVFEEMENCTTLSKNFLRSFWGSSTRIVVGSTICPDSWLAYADSCLIRRQTLIGIFFWAWMMTTTKIFGEMENGVTLFKNLLRSFWSNLPRSTVQPGFFVGSTICPYSCLMSRTAPSDKLKKICSS